MQYTKCMATAKKSSGKKTTKSTAVKTIKKPVARKKPVSNKVDIYPNRMTFWVAAAAGSLLVLFAVLIAYS